jgi:hypothetical protein
LVGRRRTTTVESTIDQIFEKKRRYWECHPIAHGSSDADEHENIIQRIGKLEQSKMEKFQMHCQSDLCDV